MNDVALKFIKKYEKLYDDNIFLCNILKFTWQPCHNFMQFLLEDSIISETVYM